MKKAIFRKKKEVQALQIIDKMIQIYFFMVYYQAYALDISSHFILNEMIVPRIHKRRCII